MEDRRDVGRAPSSRGWPGTWGCGPVLTPEVLKGSAYPRLALMSSLDSQRNPSGWMKQSGPRVGEVGLDTQEPCIPPRASALPGPGTPPSLSTGPPHPRSLGLDAHPPQRGRSPSTAQRSVPAPQHHSCFHGNHISLVGLTGFCPSPLACLQPRAGKVPADGHGPAMCTKKVALALQSRTSTSSAPGRPAEVGLAHPLPARQGRARESSWGERREGNWHLGCAGHALCFAYGPFYLHDQHPRWGQSFFFKEPINKRAPGDVWWLLQSLSGQDGNSNQVCPTSKPALDGLDEAGRTGPSCDIGGTWLSHKPVHSPWMVMHLLLVRATSWDSQQGMHRSLESLGCPHTGTLIFP